MDVVADERAALDAVLKRYDNLASGEPACDPDGD